MAARDLPQDADFAESVVQVLQALQASVGVAILGAPGCGKTTCLAICKVGLTPVCAWHEASSQSVMTMLQAIASGPVLGAPSCSKTTCLAICNMAVFPVCMCVCGAAGGRLAC